MLLERIVCGRTRSNAYVYGTDGERALIVDAGAGAAARVTEIVRSEGLIPQALVLTHGHPDHIWTARLLADAYEIPAYIHAGDLRWFADPATGTHLPVVRFAGAAIARARRMRPQRLEVVGEDASISVGGFEIDVLHTPGHSRGSVCLRVGDVCFAGDTIFRGNVGHAVYPGGNRGALRGSIRSKLLPLPDDLRLFPGHGGETSVGAERQNWERFVSSGV